MNPAPRPPFLSIPEISKLLGVGTARGYQLAAEGIIPHIKIGRKVLVPTAAFEQWLAEMNEQALKSVRKPD